MLCPNCGSKAIHWRSGVGFEHEVRCSKCSLCWEPGKENEAVVELANRKQAQEIARKRKRDFRALIPVVERYRAKFRVLAKWKIIVKDDKEHYAQCTPNSRRRVAIIYPYSRSNVVGPDNYVLHEVLHMALSSTCHGSRKERFEKRELLVQDMCGLLE